MLQYATKFSVKEADRHGKRMWRVTFTRSNKLTRKFFETKGDAEKFVAEQKAAMRLMGERWVSVPPAAKVELLTAYQRAQKGGYTLTQALDAWEERTAPNATTLGQLIRAATEARANIGLRAATLSNNAHYWKFLLSELGNVPVSTITPEQIRAPMRSRGWSALQQIAYRTHVGTLFRWGIRNGMVHQNPVERIERPRVEARPPDIFGPRECRRLMEFVRSEFPALLPCVSVMLFAGIRPVESTRLRWDDIRLGQSRIVVESAASKIRQRRLVTIEPALTEWLILTPQNERSGTLAKPVHRLRMEQMRKAFGHWPADVLRHTFVSYHVAHFRDVPRTALEAGHSVDILMRHYRELTTPEAAAEFWGIRPA